MGAPRLQVSTASSVRLDEARRRVRLAEGALRSAQDAMRRAVQDMAEEETTVILFPDRGGRHG